MLNVLSVEAILDTLTLSFDQETPKTEVVSLEEALGRILSQELLSPEDVPAFDRSTVDGYAVVARATEGASESIPSLFVLRGEVTMGRTSDVSIEEESALYVPTGGALPKGADAVAMIEDVDTFGDEIALRVPLRPRDNVVKKGDDVAVGQQLLEKGTLLKPQHMGLLAALGVTTLEVYKKPRVGILSTGDEVVPIGTHPLPMGKVRDANGPLLQAFLKEEGCQVSQMLYASDDPKDLEKAMETLLASSDLVLLSGGSSVGTKDHTAQVLNKLGPPGVLFHGAAIKPGKPTMGAGARGKPIIGLPGHPASCMIAFEAIVAPMIHRLFYRRQRKHWTLPAQSTTNIHTNQGRDVYLTLSLEKDGEDYQAMAMMGQSGMVSLLSSADGYTVIKKDQEGVLEKERLWMTLFGGDRR